MEKWMQFAQEKKLQWKTQFEVQLHICRKSCKCPIQICIYHSTLTVPREAALHGTSVEVSDLFSLCKLFLKGKTEHNARLPFYTHPQNSLSLWDGADLKGCQQHQEGQQCRLRLSAREYRHRRGTPWRLMQLNELLVSKAEMGTEQWHHFLFVSWGSRALWSVIQCSLSDWNVFRLPVKVILAWQTGCYSKIHVQWTILAVRILVRYL